MFSRRRLARFATVGAIATIVAACGGGAEEAIDLPLPDVTLPAAQPDEAPQPGDTSPEGDSPSPGDVTPWDGDPDAEFESGAMISLPAYEPFIADIDTQVQFFGFVFDLADISIEYMWMDPSTFEPIQTDFFEYRFALPTRAGRGVINASVTNLGSETITPSPQLLVEWGSEFGDHVAMGGSDFPPLPGFGTVQGTLGFGLSASDLETWNTDTAVLALGDQSLSRVTVPLGSHGELLTRMALTQEVDAEFESEDEWIVAVRSLTVQWEDERFRQTTTGTAVLVLEYDVVESISTFERCTITRSNYQLELPWGGTLASSAALPETGFCVPPGGSLAGRHVYFSVGDQEDFSGTYTFEFTFLGGGSTEFVVSLP